MQQNEIRKEEYCDYGDCTIMKKDGEFYDREECCFG